MVKYGMVRSGKYSNKSRDVSGRLIPRVQKVTSIVNLEQEANKQPELDKKTTQGCRAVHAGSRCYTIGHPKVHTIEKGENNRRGGRGG